jgi:hypothetical protein
MKKYIEPETAIKLLQVGVNLVEAMTRQSIPVDPNNLFPFAMKLVMAEYKKLMEGK